MDWTRDVVSWGMVVSGYLLVGLSGLFESHPSSHLHSNLPGECVPSCLDLLEAIVVSPGQGLKSLDIIVDVDFIP